MIVGFWQSQSFKMALEIGRFVPDQVPQADPPPDDRMANSERSILSPERPECQRKLPTRPFA